MKELFFVSLLFFGLSVSYAQTRNQLADRKIKTLTQQIADKRKEGRQSRTIFSRYDKRGNTIEYIEYLEDSTIAKWEKFSFNKKGDEVFYQELDKKGRQRKKTISVFDSFGNKTEEKIYNAQDSLIEHIFYTFNNFNIKTKEENFDGEGKMKTKAIYRHDRKGMIVEKIIYNAADEVIYTRTYKYEY